MRNTSTNYIKTHTNRRRDGRITYRIDFVGWHPDDLAAVADRLQTSPDLSVREVGAGIALDSLEDFPEPKPSTMTRSTRPLET